MRFGEAVERLARSGGDNWAVHRRAGELIAEGRHVVDLTIGEPDMPTPGRLIEDVCDALRRGRTGYSDGAGEPALRCALAARHAARSGREISDEQVLCFPGTQTALFAAMAAVAGPGAEVVVGDPMYATYESVVASSGAAMATVPLRAANGFRIAAADVEAEVTNRTTAILLNTPHNPTGAVLTEADIRAIGEVARAHDLWILCDEVYDELVFEGGAFVSPLSLPELAERVVVMGSISKSHAAPGLRSGWCVGSAAFCARLLPLAEAMLFGNQPFIADATARAVALPSDVAPGMCRRFRARAERLADGLHAETALRVHRPEAGMFALVDVSSTGMDGEAFAWDLLETGGVGVMPGASFGASLRDWVRVSLTAVDDVFDEGCRRIVAHVNR